MSSNINNLYSMQPPLINMQAELLKLFSTDIPGKYLSELKNVIARFLLDKARNNADAAWNEKGYSDEKLQQILNNK